MNYRLIRYSNGDLAIHTVEYDSDMHPVVRSKMPLCLLASEHHGTPALGEAIEGAREALNLAAIPDALFKRENVR